MREITLNEVGQKRPLILSVRQIRGYYRDVFTGETKVQTACECPVEMSKNSDSTRSWRRISTPEAGKADERGAAGQRACRRRMMGPFIGGRAGDFQTATMG